VLRRRASRGATCSGAAEAVDRDGHGVGEAGGRAGDGGQEVAAVDELHGDEPLRVGDEVVEADEVVVADVGEGPELALEPVERLGVVGAQGLEGDAGAGGLVEDLVDDAVAAGAEATHDGVAGGAREREAVAGEPFGQGAG
jgi:hypothetical protein